MQGRRRLLTCSATPTSLLPPASSCPCREEALFPLSPLPPALSRRPMPPARAPLPSAPPRAARASLEALFALLAREEAALAFGCAVGGWMFCGALGYPFAVVFLEIGFGPEGLFFPLCGKQTESAGMKSVAGAHREPQFVLGLH